MAWAWRACAWRASVDWMEGPRPHALIFWRCLIKPFLKWGALVFPTNWGSNIHALVSLECSEDRSQVCSYTQLDKSCSVGMSRTFGPFGPFFPPRVKRTSRTSYSFGPLRLVQLRISPLSWLLCCEHPPLHRLELLRCSSVDVGGGFRADVDRLGPPIGPKRIAGAKKLRTELLALLLGAIGRY